MYWMEKKVKKKKLGEKDGERDEEKTGTGIMFSYSIHSLPTSSPTAGEEKG